MPDHRFHIGISVKYRPTFHWQDAPDGKYLITGCLPQGDDGELKYRIKHSAETHERVAKESELT